MPLGYELVADSGALTSAVTQYDFTGLDITSDDKLFLSCDFNDVSSSNLFLYVNDDVTDSNYRAQYSLLSGTTVNGDRRSFPYFTIYNGLARINTSISLTEGGYFTYKADSVSGIGTTTPFVSNIYGGKLATITNISKLSIKSSATNGIGINSRFKLYKLVAEPLADITVDSDTTTVEITGLSLDSSNELLLVSDIVNPNASTSTYYRLYVNSNETPNNYYHQKILFNDGSETASRNNYSSIGIVDAKSLIDSYLKITNSGYFVSQNFNSRNYSSPAVSEKLEITKLSTTFTVSSLTSLKIESSVADEIGTGSRFKLYKLK